MVLCTASRLHSVTATMPTSLPPDPHAAAVRWPCCTVRTGPFVRHDLNAADASGCISLRTHSCPELRRQLESQPPAATNNRARALPYPDPRLPPPTRTTSTLSPLPCPLHAHGFFHAPCKRCLTAARTTSRTKALAVPGPRSQRRLTRRCAPGCGCHCAVPAALVGLRAILHLRNAPARRWIAGGRR